MIQNKPSSTVAPSEVTLSAWLLGICSAISFTTAMVVAIWAQLVRPQDYPEPIVGIMTWYDGEKSQDINAIYFFGGMCFVLMVVFQRGLKWAEQHLNVAAIRELISLGWVVSLPTLGWLLETLIQERKPPTPLMFMALWVCGWAWIAAVGHRAKTESSIDLLRLGVSGMAAVVLVFFGALGVLMPFGRLGIPGEQWAQWLPWLPWVVAIAAWGWLIIEVWRGVEPLALQERIVKLGAYCGLLLPLYWFALVPPLMRDSGPLNHDRTAQIWIATTMLWLVCTGASVAWMRREERAATTRNDRFWYRFFQPLSLASLASFIGATSYTVAQLPPDYWHDGEAMLPWHQLWNFGSIPFVDFNCALGLNSILRGAINQFLWNGWTGTFIHASVVLFALGAATLVLGAWFSAGPLAAVAVALLCAPTLDRYQMVVPLIIILISPRLIERRSVWLICWLFGSLAATFFNPSTGIAMALASLPVALWMTWRAWREDTKTFRTWGIGALLLMALILVITPVGRMLIGLYQFVKENQFGYVQQAGLPLSDIWWRMIQSINTVSVSGLYDLLIFLWIPFAAITGALWVSEMSRARETRRYGLLVGYWIPAVWVVVLSKWTSIRIEYTGLGRGGFASYLCIVMIGSVFVLASERTRRLKLMGAMAILAMGCLYHLSPLTEESSPTNSPFLRREIPADFVLITPEQSALSGGGYCVGSSLEVGWIEQVIKLRQQFPADAGMFALNSRNMMYVYLHEKVPSQYSATYYLANDQMQRRVISELSANHTRLMFMSRPFTSGEGPITLRSMRMGRWVMTHFRPIGSLANCFGVWRDRPLSEAEQWQAANLLEKILAGEDYSYNEGNLQSLPSAWGGSLATITSTLDLHTDLTSRIITASPNPLEKMFPTARKPAIYFDLSYLPRPTGEADYLALTLLFSKAEFKTPVKLQLEWIGSDGNAVPGMAWVVPMGRVSTTSDIGPGVLEAPVLIPLAYRPLWVMGPQPVALRVSIVEPVQMTVLGVGKPALWSMKP